MLVNRYPGPMGESVVHVHTHHGLGYQFDPERIAP